LVPEKIPIQELYKLDSDKIYIEKTEPTFDVPAIISTNSYITIDTSNAPKGILFVANTYYKGWKLSGHGQNRRAMKANYTFQGYLISKPGKFDIVFRHENSYIGLLLSVAGAVMILLITIADFKLNHSKKKIREMI